MLLVDTSIWIEHLRKRNSPLGSWLAEGLVLHHEFVTQELALGELKNRSELLGLLRALPHSPALAHEEFLVFVEDHKLQGKGLGLVDIHLLGSAMVSGARLATLDKKLMRSASAIGILAR